MRMKCRYCGADLKENSKFCPKCGKMTAQGGSGPAG
ncbi:zinc-ribbon domain-containing protein, partial [Enterocloster asparagiformis]